MGGGCCRAPGCPPNLDTCRGGATVSALPDSPAPPAPFLRAQKDSSPLTSPAVLHSALDLCPTWQWAVSPEASCAVALAQHLSDIPLWEKETSELAFLGCDLHKAPGPASAK